MNNTDRLCGNDLWDSRYACVKPAGHPITAPGLTDHDYRYKGGITLVPTPPDALRVIDVDAWLPQHASYCAAAPEDDECICGVGDEYLRMLESSVSLDPTSPDALTLEALTVLIHDAMPDERNWRRYFDRVDEGDGWWLVIKRTLSEHLAARLLATLVPTPPDALRDRMLSVISALLDYCDHDVNCESCATLRGADCDCGWNEECIVAEALLAEGQ